MGSLIVASTTDQASKNIAGNLIQYHGFVPQNSSTSSQSIYFNSDTGLLIQSKECIYVEPEDITIDTDRIYFASKHRSSSGTPALTVHATGNLNKQAEFGGRPEEVSFVEPSRMREAVAALRAKVADSHLDIDVTMEATHHGPTSFLVPTCFVEIGSGPHEWSDPELGRIAADAIVASLSATQRSGDNAVGFGGTHYSDKITRLNIAGDFNVGHIVPKYAFDRGVTQRVVGDVFRKTVGGCGTAIVDWKGVKGGERRRLLEWLQHLNVDIVKV